ncbi:hypothetical protein CVT24_008369 [Panaeolus cyanescens]|uniref:Uncharacterized protein n=1 Tax=Panaeolus cyanescens TaxID=181874 RepID=A0A409VC73_9AGAR|nr:hypothetical protein CVT24_008369 [Panaeolus cyanescens]
MERQKKHALAAIEHVYGPYDDFAFFDPQTFPPPGRVPYLTGVELYFNKSQIGFDDTEYINKPPVGSILEGNQDIIMFGVLEIEKLDWLLPQAQKILELDLREHDNEIHSINGRSALSLKNIYGSRAGDGYKLKVRIACVKRMAANVMSKNYPGVLIVSVATENRNFAVRSMHPVTMSRSRVFLERANLHLTIQKLIEADEDKTPVHKRDYPWLVDRYYKLIHSASSSPSLRYVKPSRKIHGISTEPRQVRHLAHAHLRGLFAEHAEWLLAMQVATASKNAQLLDIPSWIVFCREAQEDSLSAKKAHVPWGIFHSDIKNASYPRFEKLAGRLARFGDTQTFWEKRLKSAVKRASKQKERKSSSPMRTEEKETRKNFNNFQFDSDFSEASTQHDSSDDSSEARFRKRPAIPSFLLQPPTLRPGSFDWPCPSSECPFSIDLLSVSPSLLSKLSPAQRHYILKKSWSLKDDMVQEIINILVSDHYEGHLSDLGFSLQSTNKPNGWRIHVDSESSPTKGRVKKEESSMILTT